MHPFKGFTIIATVKGPPLLKWKLAMPNLRDLCTTRILTFLAMISIKSDLNSTIRYQEWCFQYYGTALIAPNCTHRSPMTSRFSFPYCSNEAYQTKVSGLSYIAKATIPKKYRTSYGIKIMMPRNNRFWKLIHRGCEVFPPRTRMVSHAHCDVKSNKKSAP